MPLIQIKCLLSPSQPNSRGATRHPDCPAARPPEIRSWAGVVVPNGERWLGCRPTISAKPSCTGPRSNGSMASDEAESPVGFNAG